VRELTALPGPIRRHWQTIVAGGFRCSLGYADGQALGWWRTSSLRSAIAVSYPSFSRQYTGRVAANGKSLGARTNVLPTEIRVRSF